MTKLTVYRIERETDPAYKYSIQQFADRILWKVFYNKDEKVGGIAWADGKDELDAYMNFRKVRLNSETVITDKYEIELGGEEK
jgi:hypothetical protein